MPIPPEYDNVPTNFEPIKIGKEPPRQNDPIWICADPDGKEYEVAQRNIRDWERRGEGWKVIGKKQPKVKAAPATKVEETDAPIIKADAENPVETPMDAAPDVLSPLNDLRAKATNLGIEWKPQWGLKRLTKEIEQASEGQE